MNYTHNYISVLPHLARSGRADPSNCWRRREADGWSTPRERSCAGPLAVCRTAPLLTPNFGLKLWRHTSPAKTAGLMSRLTPFSPPVYHPLSLTSFSITFPLLLLFFLIVLSICHILLLAHHFLPSPSLLLVLYSSLLILHSHIMSHRLSLTTTFYFSHFTSLFLLSFCLPLDPLSFFTLSSQFAENKITWHF